MQAPCPAHADCVPQDRCTGEGICEPRPTITPPPCVGGNVVGESYGNSCFEPECVCSEGKI